MIDIQLLLIVLILIIYSSLEGVKDSLITAKKGFAAFSFNEHVIFVLQRGCIGVLFFVLLHWKFALIINMIYVLIFSFFHNGFYGESMKKLGFKKYSWTYKSPTSTAKLELNFEFRLFLLILGILILIVYITN